MLEVIYFIPSYHFSSGL